MNKIIAPFLALFVIGLMAVGCAPADAQQTRTLHDDEWCDRDNWEHDNDGERYCEVREITLSASRDLITVDGRQNGGIKVEGWNRKEILVRAKVTTHARTEAAAERLAEDVEIHTDRTIYADVPETQRKEWASVSYRLMVPRRSNLSLETYNGGISIENVEGEMDFEALNGGLNLIDLAGDVHGGTTNGGVTVELTGSAWKGDGLNVETTNGGVKIYVPDDYSADLETRTVNGRVDVDFPVMVQGRIDRRISTKLGKGGKMIRVITTNGGVKVRRG